MTIKRLIIISMFAALIAVSTFINIPVPPVSFTLQTLMIVLTGLLLSPVDAFLAVLVYLTVGAIGVPVFTTGGGPQSFLAPTGGFLLSFLMVAPGVSICKSKTKSILNDSLVMFIFGFIVVYIFGIAIFMYATQLDFLYTLGVFIPYYIWDIVKLVFAYLVYYYMPESIIKKHLKGR